jgi:hypothetical protein
MHSCQAAIQSGWIVGGGWAQAHAARAVRSLEALDSDDKAAQECVAAALESTREYLPSWSSSPEGAVFENAKTALQERGVLDPTLILSRGLPIAWSHVRAILQTGAWDMVPLPPSPDDD